LFKDQKYLTTDEIASILGITRQTVVNYIKQGRIESIRSGKAYKIPLNAFITFARSEGITDNPLSLLPNYIKPNKKTTSFESAIDISTKKLKLNPVPIIIEESSNELYYLSVQISEAQHKICLRIKEGMFIIGRHSFASFSIQDPYISSTHLILYFKDGHVTIMDQSTNGTFVGNLLLKYGESKEIGDGDEFIAGQTLFEIISPHRIDKYFET